MQELVAKKALKYGRRALRPDDRFPVARAHSRVLQATGLASPAPVVEAEAPQPEPRNGRKPGGAKRRTYKRRDMRAES